MKEIYCSFSHPGLGPNQETLQFITRCHGKDIIRRSFQTHGRLIAQRSPGLREVIELWLSVSEHALWHPTIGKMRHALLYGPQEQIYICLIEIALMAHLDDTAGSWAFRLIQPSTLWAGRWVLPEMIAGQIEADGKRVRLHLETDQGSACEALLSRQAELGGWAASQLPAGTLELPTVSLDNRRSILLLPRGTVDEEMLPSHPSARFQTMDKLPAIGVTLRRTAELLLHHAPRYLDWVSGVTGYLAPVSTPDGMLVDASSPRLCGLISLAADPRPMALGEMLVHEASHQYFFIAKRLGPVDDGSDTKQYHSPVARQYRPIEKILLAFHAMANVVLLYRQCIASGAEDNGFCESFLARTLDQLDQLQQPLSATTALTEVGRALWEPLAERLSQTA